MKQHLLTSSERRGRAQKGFTLIESLIYFAILGVLLLAVGTLLFQVMYGKEKSETIQEVSQNARIINERISDAIRNAQSITGPTAGQSATTLTLAMSDSTKNPTVFSLAAGILQVKEGAGAVTPINANEVKLISLSFTNVSYPNTPGSVRVAMTISASTTSLFKQYNYQDTFNTTVTIRPR